MKKVSFKMLLLIALLILTSGILIPQVFHTNTEDYIDPNRRNLKIIGNSLKVYHMHYRRYPSSEQGLSTLTDNRFIYKGEAYGLLEKLPTDSWGNQFIYRYPATLKHDQPWDLYSVGENGKDESGKGDDINGW